MDPSSQLSELHFARQRDEIRAHLYTVRHLHNQYTSSTTYSKHDAFKIDLDRANRNFYALQAGTYYSELEIHQILTVPRSERERADSWKAVVQRLEHRPSRYEEDWQNFRAAFAGMLRLWIVEVVCDFKETPTDYTPLQRAFFGKEGIGLWRWFLLCEDLTSEVVKNTVQEMYLRLSKVRSQNPSHLLFLDYNALATMIDRGLDDRFLLIVKHLTYLRAHIREQVMIHTSLLIVAVRSNCQIVASYLWKMCLPDPEVVLNKMAQQSALAVDEFWQYALHPYRCGLFLPSLIWVIMNRWHGQWFSDTQASLKPLPSGLLITSKVHEHMILTQLTRLRIIYLHLALGQKMESQYGLDKILDLYLSQCDETRWLCELPLELGVQYNTETLSLVTCDYTQSNRELAPSIWPRLFDRSEESNRWLFILASHRYSADLVPSTFNKLYSDAIRQVYKTPYDQKLAEFRAQWDKDQPVLSQTDQMHNTFPWPPPPPRSLLDGSASSAVVVSSSTPMPIVAETCPRPNTLSSAVITPSSVTTVTVPASTTTLVVPESATVISEEYNDRGLEIPFDWQLLQSTSRNDQGLLMLPTDTKARRKAPNQTHAFKTEMKQAVHGQAKIHGQKTKDLRSVHDPSVLKKEWKRDLQESYRVARKAQAGESIQRLESNWDEEADDELPLESEETNAPDWDRDMDELDFLDTEDEKDEPLFESLDTGAHRASRAKSSGSKKIENTGAHRASRAKGTKKIEDSTVFQHELDRATHGKVHVGKTGHKTKNLDRIKDPAERERAMKQDLAISYDVARKKAREHTTRLSSSSSAKEVIVRYPTVYEDEEEEEFEDSNVLDEDEEAVSEVWVEEEVGQGDEEIEEEVMEEIEEEEIEGDGQDNDDSEVLSSEGDDQEGTVEGQEELLIEPLNTEAHRAATIQGKKIYQTSAFQKEFDRARHGKVHLGNTYRKTKNVDKLKNPEARKKAIKQDLAISYDVARKKAGKN